MAATLTTDQRVLQGVAATITATFRDQNGSEATPSGVVTVGVTRADGTVVLAPATATTSPTTTTRAVALTATQTATLDVLTATWSISGAVVETTTVEIIGGYWASESEIRNSDAALFDPAKFASSRLFEVRDECTAMFEDTTNIAGTPRFRRIRMSGSGGTRLVLPNPYLRTVRSVSIDGATFTAPQLAAIPPAVTGIAECTDGNVWPSGVDNIVIEYEHGMDRPFPDLRRAWFRWVRHELASSMSGIPDRAISMVDGGNGASFRIATPGRNGALTGIGDIDEVIARRTFKLFGIA